MKDASVVPLPWREDDYRLKEIGGGAKLAIGYYDFDGEVHVHPPIKRAMKQVIDALKKAGHTGALRLLYGSILAAPCTQLEPTFLLPERAVVSS